MSNAELIAGVKLIREHAENLLGDVDHTWPIEELLRMLGSDKVNALLDPTAFTITAALEAAEAEDDASRLARLQYAVRKLAAWSGTDIAALIEDDLIEEGDLG